MLEKNSYSCSPSMCVCVCVCVCGGKLSSVLEGDQCVILRSEQSTSHNLFLDLCTYPDTDWVRRSVRLHLFPACEFWRAVRNRGENLRASVYWGHNEVEIWWLYEWAIRTYNSYIMSGRSVTEWMRWHGDCFGLICLFDYMLWVSHSLHPHLENMLGFVHVGLFLASIKLSIKKYIFIQLHFTKMSVNVYTLCVCI